MTDFNFATATPAELAAAGYTLTVKKSQAKTRRTRKSAWGAQPSMTNSKHAAPVKAQYGTETGTNSRN